MPDPVVVVGAGIAGCATASALGEAGVDVVLLDAGDRLPYDRPPLSKKILVDGTDADSVTIEPREWWNDHHVDLRTNTRVSAVGPHVVQTSSGDSYRWSSLVVATGGTPRPLDVPGSDLAGVFTVQDLDGALECAAALSRDDTPVTDVVIVGAGFVGCEAAAAIRRTGRSVTVLETAAHPLVHAVGARVAQWLCELHRGEGVDMRTGVEIVAFEGDAGVRAVRTADGTRHPADLVIVAIGIDLDLAVARAAGALPSPAAGVDVDDRMRTCVDGVLAVGDIARYPSRFAGLTADGARAPYRCEHYNVAVGHGAAAARTILGDDTPYDEPPSYWTDQFGLTLNACGPTELADDVRIRGSLGDHDFLALYFRGGVVVAGLACGQHREFRSLRRLLQRGTVVTADALTDPSVTLAQLDHDTAAA